MLQALLHEWYRPLGNSFPVFITALSLDIQKAFDSVNHQLPLSKLKPSSLHNSAALLLESYLTGRAQVIKVNGSTISDTFNIVSGVLQGSILRPLLFNVKVNDLLPRFFNLFAYADDTVIYSIVSTENLSLLSAASLFKKVQMWYTSSYFTINVSKTHACIFSSGNSQALPTSTLIKPKFKQTQYTRHLDSHLTFKTYAHQVTTATNRLIYLFRKIRFLMNVQSALKFCTTYIRPKLMYCSSPFIDVLATFTTQLKALQNKSVRVILKASKSFSVFESKLLLNIPVLEMYR